MLYRPEIDGIRGLAIIAVLFFHAEILGFTGGYIGVDLFFVISGYLITRILLNEMEDGRFSLKKFYERRCRRILPALFFTLAGVLIAAWFILLPYDFKNFGRSLAATTTFWANIFFWRQVGYFDTAVYTKPLLHCWSLSLEEQYYILFPLFFLFLFRRFGVRLWKAIMVTALISFVISVVQVAIRPTTAFYLLHTKAWELLLGSLVATYPWRNPVPLKAATPLAMLGLAGIIAPMFFYSGQTPFPGLAALPPCLGTALIIHVHQSGHQASWVGRWLAHPVMTGLGKISYSMYLWHWPLLVFPRYIYDEPLSLPGRLTALAAAIVMAVISWHLLEDPIRRRKVFKSQRLIFILSILGIVVFTTAGRTIRHTDGFPSRLPEEARIYALAAEDSYKVTKPRPYYKTVIDGVEYEVGIWTMGPEGKSPELVLWGDSHASMWRAAFDQLSARYEVSGLVVDHRACQPLYTENAAAGGGGWTCAGFNRAVRQMIVEKQIPDAVISTRYSPLFDISPLAEPEEAAGRGPDTPGGSQGVFARGLETTARDLNQGGAGVWLLENVPEYTTVVVNLLTRNAMAGRSFSDTGYPVRYYEARNAKPRRVFEQLAGSGFRVLRMQEFFCPDGWCLPGDDKSSFYTDTNHLTNYGALKFKSAVEPIFRDIVERRSGAAGPAAER